MRIIRKDNLESAEVLDLIAEHLSGMHENSPPESVYALGVESLKSDDVTVFAAWDDGRLSGIGALKAIDAQHGEIKSMRTANAFLRKGVAASLLEHIISEASQRGYKLLSLETGSGDAFDPAIGLYRKRGFRSGDAFGGYTKSAFNQFFHLDLPAV